MTIIDGTNDCGDNVRLLIDGSTVRAVYSDALMDALDALGPVVVKRASRVEPAAGGGWIADMAPSKGPVLFEHIDSERKVTRSFRTRQAALDAERQWLREQKGL